MPTVQRPRSRMSPPAFTAYSRTPAPSSSAAARSTDQPLTRPDGSIVSGDAARMSK
jgi:hypothetical protein